MGDPFLLDLLYAEYQEDRRQLQEHHEARTRDGDGLDLLVAGAPESLAEFLRWAHAYLDQHRPVEAFAADYNYGILLSNNQRCLVSPDTTAHGATQSGVEGTDYVAIMEGTDRRRRRSQGDGSMRIT